MNSQRIAFLNLAVLSVASSLGSAQSADDWRPDVAEVVAQLSNPSDGSHDLTTHYRLHGGAAYENVRLHAVALAQWPNG